MTVIYLPVVVASNPSGQQKLFPGNSAIETFLGYPLEIFPPDAFSMSVKGKSRTFPIFPVAGADLFGNKENTKDGRIFFSK